MKLTTRPAEPVLSPAVIGRAGRFCRVEGLHNGQCVTVELRPRYKMSSRRALARRWHARCLSLHQKGRNRAGPEGSKLADAKRICVEVLTSQGASYASRIKIITTLLHNQASDQSPVPHRAFFSFALRAGQIRLRRFGGCALRSTPAKGVTFAGCAAVAGFASTEPDHRATGGAPHRRPLPPPYEE
jgi:hypothetical protein